MEYSPNHPLNLFFADSMTSLTNMPVINEPRSLLKWILESNEHSDLVIFCGEDTHEVHKAIICPQSDVLAAMCDGPFIVRTQQSHFFNN